MVHYQVSGQAAAGPELVNWHAFVDVDAGRHSAVASLHCTCPTNDRPLEVGSVGGHPVVYVPNLTGPPRAWRVVYAALYVLRDLWPVIQRVHTPTAASSAEDTPGDAAAGNAPLASPSSAPLLPLTRLMLTGHALQLASLATLDTASQSLLLHDAGNQPNCAVPLLTLLPWSIRPVTWPSSSLPAACAPPPAPSAAAFHIRVSETDVRVLGGSASAGVQALYCMPSPAQPPLLAPGVLLLVTVSRSPPLGAFCELSQGGHTAGEESRPCVTRVQWLRTTLQHGATCLRDDSPVVCPSSTAALGDGPSRGLRRAVVDLFNAVHATPAPPKDELKLKFAALSGAVVLLMRQTDWKKSLEAHGALHPAAQSPFRPVRFA